MCFVSSARPPDELFFDVISPPPGGDLRRATMQVSSRRCTFVVPVPHPTLPSAELNDTCGGGSPLHLGAQVWLVVLRGAGSMGAACCGGARDAPDTTPASRSSTVAAALDCAGDEPLEDFTSLRAACCSGGADPWHGDVEGLRRDVAHAVVDTTKIITALDAQVRHLQGEACSNAARHMVLKDATTELLAAHAALARDVEHLRDVAARRQREHHRDVAQLQAVNAALSARLEHLEEQFATLE